MRDGSEIKGSFVKMLGDKLFIKEKDKEISIPHGVALPQEPRSRKGTRRRDE